MKNILIALALLVAAVIPVAAQDDCPPGHVRHPAVSPLDDTYMRAAFRASFVAIFGREPTMVDGAGLDDGGYYIRQSNHFGVYGDDQCHAGWSGYWESWLRTGHGDLTLVQTPATFQPSTAPPVVVPPVVVPPVIPITPITPITPPVVPEGVLMAIGVLTAKVDTLGLQVTDFARASADAHAAIQQNVTDGRAENRSSFAFFIDHWKAIVGVATTFIGGYVTAHQVAP